MTTAAQYAQQQHPLTGGQWVRRGASLVWIEHQHEADERPAYDPHALIACPFCLARMDERCKGNTRERDHRSRLIRRVCSCGGPVRPREPICGFCRAETARSAA